MTEMNEDTTKASKFMSLVLRHEPAKAGLTLDEGGWADIDALIAGSHGRLTHERLLAAVADNNKRRFAISDDGKRVRARQGHSVPVDLGLGAVEPPATLFHGTVEKFMDAIEREGLDKRARQHVHLSPDRETATIVARRRGKPVTLRVDAKAMHAAGHAFLLSENGVWLTDAVPPEFLKRD